MNKLLQLSHYGIVMFSLLLLPSRSGAESPSFFVELGRKIKTATLSNGIRVVFLPRRHAPVFYGQIWVKVGGVDERPGKTGVSHLLEHMAFKGTSIIGTKDYEKEKPLLNELYALKAKWQNKHESKEVSEKVLSLYSQLDELWDSNEFSRIYIKHGANGLNAGTGKDYTFYRVALPSVAFDFWVNMEISRITDPVFREFYRELDVVHEERRWRVDDSPYGKLYESVLATAFLSHPNRLPTVGWSADLAMLTVEDVEQLFRTYYRPDNIVISLVGDLQWSEILPKLKSTFGEIPTPVGELPIVGPLEETQNGQRRIEVIWDAEPIVMLAWHKPTYPHPDDGAFAILHSVLTDGRASIFHKKLIKTKMAVSISTSEGPGERYPSVFIISATPAPGISPDRLITEIEKILNKMASTPIVDDDIVAAKRRVRIDLMSTIKSGESLSYVLGKSTLLWNDWRALGKSYEHIIQTSAKDIQKLVRHYLSKDKRTTGILWRKKSD